MIEEAYKRALITLKSCVQPAGFFASGLPGGYRAIWARDAMIMSLGASLLGQDFKKPAAQSLKTLTVNQSARGQIPNAVGDYNRERRSRITFNSIDSTLWYLIGHQVYARAFHGQRLLKKYRAHIEKALTWLVFQDPNEDGLLVQQPTMDWMDAFPHKYGRTINTQALYYAVLKMYGQGRAAERFKKIVNGQAETYLSLYDPKHGYYLPWIWKTHEEIREEEYWFDTLGNLLAIVTNLATPQIRKSILGVIEKNKIDKPYPCKAIWPPLRPADYEWHPYFNKSAARRPYHYLNAGSWPYVGGFYVAALVKDGKLEKARKALANLALANYAGYEREWRFSEWLDGQTGKPAGTPFQGWSAAMYIFAYECVRKNRLFYFK